MRWMIENVFGKKTILTRCGNKNTATLKRARKLFLENSYSSRIEAALFQPSKPNSYLFYMDYLKSQPVWTSLPDSLSQNTVTLEKSWGIILAEFRKVRELSFGWVFNTTQGEDRDWGVFSFINQGRWNSENAELCPETSNILMNLSELMSDKTRCQIRAF